MRLLVLLLVVATLASCAVKTVEVKPTYKVRANQQTAQPAVSIANSACLNFVDNRKDTTSWYKDLSSEDAEAWVDIALKKISSDSLSLSEVPADSQASFVVHKAYVKHMSTSISGVVVITIAKEDFKKVYRGQKVRGNMFGATSEYESLLDAALGEALTKVFADKETLAVIESSSCQPGG